MFSFHGRVEAMENGFVAPVMLRLGHGRRQGRGEGRKAGNLARDEAENQKSAFSAPTVSEGETLGAHQYSRLCVAAVTQQFLNECPNN